MIEITNVSFKYSNALDFILKDFSLKISEGEFVGIIGPTGSGKSTICYLINGLIPNRFKGNFSGSVKVLNRNISNTSIEEMSEHIGYMLQEPSFQIATPYVESEITFGMENLGVSREEMDSRLEEVLDIFNIKHLQHRSTSELSEGEKQRVILASILAMKPRILVLDECSSMLDSQAKKELAIILKKLNHEYRQTIILIEHDLDFIFTLVNRVLLINNGKIVSDDSPKEILTDTLLLEKNGLLPPTLVSMFSHLRKKGLPIENIPFSYNEAYKILAKWL